MTDEKYCFVDDLRARKAEKSGAAHRKIGSKSKKCSLPSDYLTEKQKRELSGECVSYDLTKAYSWEAFKALPKHIQQEYIQRLVDKYGVGMRTISQTLFGLSFAGLNALVKREGIAVDSHATRISAEKLARFQQDVERGCLGKRQETAQEPQGEPNVAEVSADTPKEEKPQEEQHRTQTAPLSELTVTMDGLDAVLIQQLAMLFGTRPVTVSVTVTAK